MQADATDPDYLEDKPMQSKRHIDVTGVGFEYCRYKKLVEEEEQNKPVKKKDYSVEINRNKLFM